MLTIKSEIHASLTNDRGNATPPLSKKISKSKYYHLLSFTETGSCSATPDIF